MARLATFQSAAFGSVPGFEVNLDQAHAGQRARLGVIHIRSQGEEALEGVGDVRFNLLRRHTVVKRSDHDHWHVDAGEKVDRHAEQVEHADQHHHETKHDDEVGIAQGKLRHYCAPPSSLLMSTMLFEALLVSLAGVGVTAG